MPEHHSLTPSSRAPHRHKVGYVLKMYPRFSETFIVTEILAREETGLEVEIFSLRPPVDPRFHDSLSRVKAPVRYVSRVRDAQDLWEAMGEAIRTLGPLDSATLAMLLQASAHDAAQALEVAMAARRNGLTHLHAHFASVATTVARLAARLAGITYSFTAHAKDLFHHEVDSADVRAKAADAHHVVTISQYNVGHLLGIGAPHDQVHLVYNGLDLSAFVPTEPRAERRPTDVLRIVSVGRLIEKKGFEYLIDACHELHSTGVPIHCDIVGGGEREQALRAQISEHGLGDVVHLHGPLPQDRVREAVAGADVFVAPCVVGSDGNTDGLPTVVLEAMALGTPCVSTDVTGLVEAIEHESTGLIVPQRDSHSLALAITRLRLDRPLTAALRCRARAKVESTFDSHRQAAALNALLPGERVQEAAA